MFNVSKRRLADSLRERKNDLIILKTLLRKAAEYGGVHPMHIHRLSSHYTQLIEQVHTIKVTPNRFRELSKLINTKTVS